MLVPLIVVKELLGFIAVGAAHPSAFTLDHLEITREVADQLAIALHRAQLDAKIQEHTHLLEVRVAERTEELRTTKVRLEALLNSASDAIIVARMNGSIITRQVRRLIRLLDDVLMITRADLRGLEFKPGSINLINLCQEIIDEVIVVQGDAIKLEFTYQGHYQQIRIDEFLFSHILQNLMTNAIKYSEPDNSSD